MPLTASFPSSHAFSIVSSAFDTTYTHLFIFILDSNMMVLTKAPSNPPTKALSLYQPKTQSACVLFHFAIHNRS